jgi:GNAT superfamily N-acetyltransferase
LLASRSGRGAISAVKIRRARRSDKQAVLLFCRRTWGAYGDFIHKVWDEWERDRRGFFAVATVGERPIGTAKLTVLKPGEIWFEGLRVDPAFRKLGLAHVLTSFLLQKARRMNAKSVRYATGGSNLTSQHIGKTWGFNLLRRYTCFEAPPDGRRKRIFARVTDPERALLLAGEIPGDNRDGTARRNAALQLTRVLRSSHFITSMRGLASEGWTFYQIDPNFVDTALRNGELYVASAASGRTAARSTSAARPGPPIPGVIVAAPQRRQRRLLVWTLADLRTDSLSTLMSGTRRLAFDLRLREVRLVVPYSREMTIPARKVGFRQEYKGMSAVVMERGKRQE